MKCSSFGHYLGKYNKHYFYSIFLFYKHKVLKRENVTIQYQQVESI